MEKTKELNYFEILNNINVGDKVEKKNGLSYLSWAWAWGEVKKKFPNATYTIYERETEYGAVNYFTDGRTCWVKTGVTVEGVEHIEELPVMDFKNKSILLENITSFDVNKSIQRSLTKALARHGLGLYIYAGEDLPEEDKKEATKKNEADRQKIYEIIWKYESVKGVDLDPMIKWADANASDIQQLSDAKLNECLRALEKKYGKIED